MKTLFHLRSQLPKIQRCVKEMHSRVYDEELGAHGVTVCLCVWPGQFQILSSVEHVTSPVA